MTTRRRSGARRPIESYDQDAGRKTYAYDPHLDPQLQWAGKTEPTSFEVPTVSLPFEEGEHRRVAVKIVDDRGIESLRIISVEG